MAPEVGTNDGGFKVFERRLEGIESELREMRGLMTQLVRVEERGIADRAEMARLSSGLSELRNEVHDIREKAMRSGVTMGAIERAFWLVVAGAIAWWSGK